MSLADWGRRAVPVGPVPRVAPGPSAFFGRLVRASQGLARRQPDWPHDCSGRAVGGRLGRRRSRGGDHQSRRDHLPHTGDTNLDVVRHDAALGPGVSWDDGGARRCVFGNVFVSRSPDRVREHGPETIGTEGRAPGKGLSADGHRSDPNSVTSRTRATTGLTTPLQATHAWPESEVASRRR